MKYLDNITYSMYKNLIKLWEIVEDRGAWWTIVRGITKSQTQLKQQSTVQHEIIRKDLTFTILDS